ncbi:MAG TPA: hypothetical protein VJ805_00250 [Nitrospiraceae bacterium]|nr:hypothetical protein [Nitrospiraceae bacterium]
MATPEVQNEHAIFNQSIGQADLLPWLWRIGLYALFLFAYPGDAITIPKDKLVKLRLDDVHPLHGGQNIVIWNDGTALSQVVTWRKDLSRLYEIRYKTGISPDVMGHLARLSNTAVTEPLPPRAGFPDEPRPAITATLMLRKSIRLSKWAHEQYPKFDSVYTALLAETEKARKTTPIYKGPYDPRGLPD